MLTRRQQLKRKQDQEEEKKQKADKTTKGGDGGEKPENAKGKAKGKAKAKGKGKAKAKAKAKAANEGEEVQDQTMVPSEDELPQDFQTPKKRLFQESDNEGEQEGVGGGLPKPPGDKMVVDPYTGKMKSLNQIFEEYAPNAWKKKMRQEVGATSSGLADPKYKAKAKGRAKAGPKAKAKASPKAKANNKGSPNIKKRGRTAKVDSPAIKKEQARRRKKMEENMVEEQPEDMYDESITKCLEEHVRRLEKDGEDKDQVKEYFRTNHFKMYQAHFTFSCYWDNHAVGLVFKGGKHFAYFAFKHSKASWAFNITMASVCAYLMVSFYEQS